MSWSAEEPHTHTPCNTPPPSAHALLSAVCLVELGRWWKAPWLPRRAWSLPSQLPKVQLHLVETHESKPEVKPQLPLPSGIPRGCWFSDSKIISFSVLYFLPILNFSIVTFGSEGGLSTVCGEQIVPTPVHNSSSSITGRGLAAKFVAIFGVHVTLFAVPWAQGRQRQVTKCWREGAAQGRAGGYFDVYFAEIDCLGVEGDKSNLGTMVLP